MPVVATTPAIHEPDTWQRQVIESRERSIRVLAPAGSGKTETLGRRVGALIESGVPPRRILILTFDNQAKTSFERTLKRLGITGPVEIRTLNAFGLRTLTQHFPEARSRTARAFYGPAEELLVSFLDKTDAKSLIELFGTLKSHLFDPQEFNARSLQAWIVKHYRQLVPEKFLAAFPEAKFATRFSKQLSHEFARYEEFLESRGQIDYDDQKLRTLALLDQAPEVARQIRTRYDEVIVDEFQDINPLDQKLIELIAREATLVITGDDDQAIYGFRWASAEFLIRPDKAFSRRFTSYELRTNYRCPRLVLQRSKQLIEHNIDRVRKQPISGVDADGTIALIDVANRLSESSQIAGMIREAMRENPDLTYGDFAVLTRRNQHLDEVLVQFIAQGIPFAIRSERDLVRIWGAALELLDLSTALRHKQASPIADYRAAIANFKWFPLSVRRDHLAQFQGLTLPEVFLSLQPTLNARSIQKFEKALNQLRQNRSLVGELGVIETQFMGFDTQPGDDVEGDSGERPLELLRTILDRKESAREQAIERLRGFLATAEAATAGGGPQVDLSTYHSAKGRQWRTVFLPSVAAGRVPDPLTRSEFGELEAERRLFYVAMTRSADTLVVGHPAETSKEWNSRFLYEAGLLTRPPEESKTRKAIRESDPAVTPARTTPAPRGGAAKKGRATSNYTQVKEIEKILRKIQARQIGKVGYGGTPELLYPLQLALLLERVPYRAAPEHDLLYSWMLRDIYRHITRDTLDVIKVTEEPEYPAFKRSFTALAAWIRHKGLVGEPAKVALDTAVKTALDQRARGVTPIVEFVQNG